MLSIVTEEIVRSECTNLLPVGRAPIIENDLIRSLITPSRGVTEELVRPGHRSHHLILNQ